jgi:hypothetical protein
VPGFAETRTSAGLRPHKSASEFVAHPVTGSNSVEKSVNEAVRAVADGT